MDLYDIIKRIIGNINPVGDTNIDKKRLENLKTHEEITYKLIEDLMWVSEDRDRIEYSMKNLGQSAYSQLLDIKEMLEDCLEGETVSYD